MTDLSRAPPLKQAMRPNEVFLRDDVALDLFSPDFDRLTEQALREAASSTLAPLSSRQYFYGWKGWVRFAREREIAPLPANPQQFAKYLVFLVQGTGAKGSVTNAINAVNYVHTLNGLAPPGHASLPSTVASAVKRELAAPVDQKEPLEPWMLKAVVPGPCTPTSPVAH